MSLKLLHKIQSLADIYYNTRIDYETALELKDVGMQVRNFERLVELEAQFNPMAATFDDMYRERTFRLESNMIVIWRRGSVGLQGLLTNFPFAPDAQDVIVSVATKRRVYSEFAKNLMPLSAVIDDSDYSRKHAI